jgi:four helix bundle protein
MAGSYRDLVAWQKSLDLVVEIYRITEHFPKSEIYGLTSQLRRAAVSVPSNIAEGQAHFSKQEFRHFLRHSRGSLAELETQLLIAQKLGFLDDRTAAPVLDRINEVNRILAGLIGSLKLSS